MPADLEYLYDIATDLGYSKASGLIEASPGTILVQRDNVGYPDLQAYAGLHDVSLDVWEIDTIMRACATAEYYRRGL